MLIDSLPPATMMCAPPARMRSAAMAIDCSPELQKRLMVTPVVVTGSPARSAAMRAILLPCFAFGHGAAEDHVFDILFGNLRIFFEQRADHGGGQVVRACIAQRSAGRFSDRGTKAIDDYGFGHGFIICAQSGRRLL